MSAERHEHCKNDRAHHVDAILASDANKRIVVAGPGTGKTYLFKTLLSETKGGLTLTFINSLVEDLALELNGLSTVQTLHAFARGVMTRATKCEVRIFGRLASVIEEDAGAVGRPQVRFEPLFHQMRIGGEDLEFYRSRKDFYGHYGFTDIVYAAVKLFEANAEKIPKFGLVLVDEFQDFNLLEVNLIDFLSHRAPVVITGDDDQALYDFKKASPDFIRERFNTADFESFSLPYCSRCTSAVIESVNSIVETASSRGFLKGRIQKPYLYFSCAKKDSECDQHPTISYARLHAKQIPWFIEKCVGEIAEELKQTFSVLIISPARVQLRDIAHGLRSKGLANIVFADRVDRDDVRLVDGLKLLLADRECNLGWRIAAKSYVENGQFEALLRASVDDPTIRFRDRLPREVRSTISKLLTLIRRVRDQKPLESEALEAVLAALEIDPLQLALEKAEAAVISDELYPRNAAVRKIPIKLSTVQGCKGLAEDYVFITHFDDQYYLDAQQGISDLNICKLIVALTRARKKVFLLSSNAKATPTFLEWFPKGIVELVHDSGSAG